MQVAQNTKGSTTAKSMPLEPNAARKPYRSPSLVELDLNTAKAILEAKGHPKDAVTQKMLSLINEAVNKGQSKLHPSRVVRTFANADRSR
jgi:hypothetical protein